VGCAVTFNPRELDCALAELRNSRGASRGLRLRSLYESCDGEGLSAADFPGMLQDELQHLLILERLLRFQRAVTMLLSLLRLEGD